MLNNIIDKCEQCEQQNIAQSKCSFFAVYRNTERHLELLDKVILFH